MNRKIKIEFGEPDQYFNMSGPALAPLSLDGRLLQGKYLLNHCAYSDEGRYLLLSKYCQGYFETRRFLFVPRRKKIICFRILIYDVQNNIYYQQKSYQRCLFVESMTADKITYYEAFHNELVEFKRELLFDSSTFEVIEETGVFQ